MLTWAPQVSPTLSSPIRRRIEIGSISGLIKARTTGEPGADTRAARPRAGRAARAHEKAGATDGRTLEVYEAAIRERDAGEPISSGDQSLEHMEAAKRPRSNCPSAARFRAPARRHEDACAPSRADSLLVYGREERRRERERMFASLRRASRPVQRMSHASARRGAGRGAQRLLRSLLHGALAAGDARSAAATRSSS